MFKRSLALAGISLLVFASWQLFAAEPKSGDGPIEFNRDIRPILSDTCFHCHGPDKAKRKGDLRLDTEAGGKATVVPGKPGASELFRRITATNEKEVMPPLKSGRKLSPAQIALIRRWIEQGAPWQPHWAFIAPKRPPLPPSAGSGWPRNPIDAFVLARLQKEGLAPSAEADRTTLIRRVTLDLTGLPPTIAEVDAFLNDSAADAYEKVVDRLLRSPRYGERMALDWLDAARYADSNGYQQDRTRTLWPWRDWVVAAFNQNMPFDRFTIEQLAGDLLPGATLQQKIATGFHRNHPLNGEGGRIAEESRVDYVVDRVDTTATVWLGLTLGCCRCHDHKYDPFSQKEFYQLYAYFNNIAESGSVDRGGNAAPTLRIVSEALQQRLNTLSAEAAGLQQQLAAQVRPTAADVQRITLLGMLRRGSMLPPQRLVEPDTRAMRQKLAAARKTLDDLNKGTVETMVMEERPNPRDTFVLIRGAYDKYGAKVNPTVLTSLSPLPAEAPNNRLGLARWLMAPENPLTARVVVNRYWQLFFGAGLVKTPEDFGVQGELPAHPELLDWLATEFAGNAERGTRSAESSPAQNVTPGIPHSALRIPHSSWDIKALYRLVVTSATYRQASRTTPAQRERDPDNRLLGRGPRYRLASPVIRDQALAVSGLLVERGGGPPVLPYQPAGIWEEMSFGKITYKQDQGPNLYRRSLYTFWRRTVGPPNLFDSSARQVCTVRQVRTNTPLHALTTLNDVTYVEAARVLAERLLTQAQSPPERITLAFRLATARPPRASELAILTQALERLQRHYQADKLAAVKLINSGAAPRNPQLDVVELAAYTGLANLILNLDEVITRE